MSDDKYLLPSAQRRTIRDERVARAEKAMAEDIERHLLGVVPEQRVRQVRIIAGVERDGEVLGLLKSLERLVF